MDNFLGEIRLFSWPVIPKGWLPCDGRLLPIVQNQALFALLGVQFGGDGKATFALPDLRGRVAMGRNDWPPVNPAFASHSTGQAGGVESVMLPLSALPEHTHSVQVSNATLGNGGPAGNYPATSANANGVAAQPTYITADTNKLVTLHADTIAATGQTPIPNMQPSICLSYCIATQGVFPPRQ
ncbi:hypothetical protein C4Q28_13585 [Pseudomonas sp. SWI6]|uniref:Phage tail protein n=1 Tax=Pseudomonas taiwanensis TaxID=470150 RepID=A0ABR6V7L8_9PSED|nr:MULTISPECIES: tail fiber protein [Pseudomonas]AVD83123.1 hypothetical protein C4Q28_13585 [Pseudomonas sp. SWI6]MBC3475852.1 phage tail protein [Pseudomonas taiwanensis]MBC3489335.1 phage tail protein [Pseudomonas taiwanensis]WEZ86447.1 tail fiber protein [Pseudomonas sp. NyZ480]